MNAVSFQSGISSIPLRNETTSNPFLKFIHKFQEVLHSRSSLEGRAIAEPVDPEIAKKAAYQWNILGREAVEGGFTYIYKLNSDFDDATPHTKRIERSKAMQHANRARFPAVEIEAWKLLGLDPYVDKATVLKEFIEGRFEQRRMDLIRERNSKQGIVFAEMGTHPNEAAYSNELQKIYKSEEVYAQNLQELEKKKADERLTFLKRFDEMARVRLLGYQSSFRDDGVYLRIPDEGVLRLNWNKLRAQDPTLPEWDVIYRDGELNDSTFIDVHAEHDGFLSLSGYFFHDQVNHMIALFIQMLTSGKNGNPVFTVYRKKFKDKIQKHRRQIQIAKNETHFGISQEDSQFIKQHLKKAEACLSALIDTFTSIPYYGYLGELFESEDCFARMWSRGRWETHWRKQFESDYIDSAQMSLLWKKIELVESKYDEHVASSSKF